jgi:enoyl-CoA hydratase/carnithine racemase
MTDEVILEHADGTAIVVLNRPNALNALSASVMRALDGVLDRIAADASVRAVVVAAQGRAFSAGGDLLEFECLLRSDPQKLIATLAFNQRVFEKLESLAVPVIGAVNGTAVAGGLELLLCCDVLVAAEDAKIGDGHAKCGVVPAGGATVRLFRKLPVNRAMQLFFSASLFSARELSDWGLINEVVPAAQVLSRAKDMAAQFSDRARKCWPISRTWRAPISTPAPMTAFRRSLLPSRAIPAAKISPRAWPPFATNAHRDTERSVPDDREKRRLIRANVATYTCV